MPSFNSSSFELSRHSDFIRRHGETVDFFVGNKCTCSIIPTGSMMADANRANPNCPVCKGLGIFWTPQGQIVALIQNISQQKDLLQSGVAAPGDLVMSPDLRYTVTDFDKIHLKWSEGIPYEGQLVKRNFGTDSDTVNYQIMSVVSCVQVDSYSGSITTYNVGTDFTVSGNTITWISSNRPLDNSVYSFKYGALLEWICFAPPQPRRERGVNLGQRIILRKKHMVTFGV